MNCKAIYIFFFLVLKKSNIDLCINSALKNDKIIANIALYMLPFKLHYKKTYTHLVTFLLKNMTKIAVHIKKNYSKNLKVFHFPNANQVKYMTQS